MRLSTLAVAGAICAALAPAAEACDRCSTRVEPGRWEEQTQEFPVAARWVYEMQTVQVPGRWETSTVEVNVGGHYKTVNEQVWVPGRYVSCAPNSISDGRGLTEHLGRSLAPCGMPRQ